MSTFLPVMRVSFPAMMSEALTDAVCPAVMVTFPLMLPTVLPLCVVSSVS